MPLTPLLTRKIEDLALMLKSAPDRDSQAFRASEWPTARYFRLGKADLLRKSARSPPFPIVARHDGRKFWYGSRPLHEQRRRYSN
jgi:hypothetical protein